MGLDQKLGHLQGRIGRIRAFLHPKRTAEARARGKVRGKVLRFLHLWKVRDDTRTRSHSPNIFYSLYLYLCVYVRTYELVNRLNSVGNSIMYIKHKILYMHSLIDGFFLKYKQTTNKHVKSCLLTTLFSIVVVVVVVVVAGNYHLSIENWRRWHRLE